MKENYYGIAIVFYGIFIVRFILSWIGGDFEIEIGKYNIVTEGLFCYIPIADS